MRKCMEELVYLLRSKIQCIWIDTYEEYEVLKDLKEITNDLNGMKLFTWSHTEGLKRVPLSSKEVEELPDRKVTLERVFQVIGEAQDDKTTKNEGIYILRDLHLLNETHQVKRIIRDIKERPAKNYNPIIVVSPLVQIPMEHEKLFTVIHYDVPSKDEIRTQIDRTVQSMRKAIEKGKEYVLPTQDEVDKLVDACVGLTYNEINDVLVKSVVKHKRLSQKAVMDQKVQLVEKSGVLDYKVPDAKFEEVGGNYAFKEWVSEVEDSMTDDAVAFGCARPKGYLALGVPGTAKSYLAEALAEKWGVPLLKLSMSRIMDKLVGNSEKKIDQAFRVAKACAPCVMLWDEVEKILGGIKSSNASDSGTTARVFAACLNFLQEDNGVFVVMTSNDVSQLPPELTRSGRLDAMWYFSLPTKEERNDIFRIHFGKTGKEVSDIVMKKAVDASEHYTGAEIKEVVKIAMRKAYKRYKIDGNPALTEDDILPAVREVIPIYESSKEKIMFLEQWVNGRARYTNGRIDKEGYDTGKDDQLLDDVLLKE